MDARTVELLESSFKLLAPRGPELVDRFYAHLFAENPQVRPMFPKDMVEQKQKLLASIQLVISNLRKPDALHEPLTELGRRHLHLGTQPDHYPIVRDTLIGVMRDMAGEAWTQDFEHVWTDALNLIAGIMIEGQQLEKSSPKLESMATTKP